MSSSQPRLRVPRLPRCLYIDVQTDGRIISRCKKNRIFLPISRKLFNFFYCFFHLKRVLEIFSEKKKIVDLFILDYKWANFQQNYNNIFIPNFQTFKTEIKFFPHFFPLKSKIRKLRTFIYHKLQVCPISKNFDYLSWSHRQHPQPVYKRNSFIFFETRQKPRFTDLFEIFELNYFFIFS